MRQDVTPTRRSALFAACLLGLTAHATRAQSPERDPDMPDPLLTEQMPFCRHLAREVQRLQRAVPPPHVEADQLASDGVRLCGNGRLIPGIRRLRYAIIELEELQAGR
jgi:hypothetical protein